jgi:DNA (cytosine-5)-methyltransferase 1
MRLGSLFSGVGGMDHGLSEAGFEHAFLCEIDPWRRKVLAARFPGVPVYDDVRTVGGVRQDAPRAEGEGRHLEAGGDGPDAQPDGYEPVALDDAGRARGTLDILAGGFPCQDLSVAGKRAGFAGTRSSLFFEFARVAADLVRPGGYVLIENVPGLFSSHGGRDFALVLATLAEVGFLDGAYRVLDSRYLGVPQRRERVFILARRARGQRCAEILLEPEGGGGDFEACAAPRKGAAPGARGGAAGDRGGVGAVDGSGGGVDENGAQQGRLFTFWDGSDEASTLDGGVGRQTMPEKGRFAYVRVPAVADPLTSRPGSGAPDGDAVGNLVPDVAQPLRSNPRNNSDPGMEASMHVIVPDEAATLSSGSAPNSNAPGRRREDDDNLVAEEPQAFKAARYTRERTSGDLSPDAPPLCSDTKRGDQEALLLEPQSFKPSHYTRGKDGQPADTVPPLSADADKGDQESLLFVNPRQLRGSESSNQVGIKFDGVHDALSSDGPGAVAVPEPVVAFTERTRADGRNVEAQEDRAYALSNPGAGGRTQENRVAGGFGVRRLTPVECERLQALPDRWTAPPGVDGCSDSARYAALGDAVTSSVATWIGRRILEAEMRAVGR